MPSYPLTLSDYSTWFPGTIQPVRAGIYQRQFGLGHHAVTYCMWDGARWLLGASTTEEALTYLEVSERQEQRWRGLTAQAVEQIHAAGGLPSKKKALNN